jgi:hypothetical protein
VFVCWPSLQAFLHWTPSKITIVHASKKTTKWHQKTIIAADTMTIRKRRTISTLPQPTCQTTVTPTNSSSARHETAARQPGAEAATMTTMMATTSLLSEQNRHLSDIQKTVV